MKIVFPGIDHVFDTEINRVNVLTIENQQLLFSTVSDIYGQIHGLDGNVVVSEDNRPIALNRCAELVSEFVSFSLNRKPLLNKVASELEKIALSDDFYASSLTMTNAWEKYLFDLSMPLSCDLDFSNIGIASLIKAAGILFKEDYDSIGEKIIDYMQLVEEFDCRKIFFIYGLRDFVIDEEAMRFYNTVLQHGYDIMCIEGRGHDWLPLEERYIVDSDLCEIG